MKALLYMRALRAFICRALIYRASIHTQVSKVPSLAEAAPAFEVVSAQRQVLRLYILRLYILRLYILRPLRLGGV